MKVFKKYAKISKIKSDNSGLKSVKWFCPDCKKEVTKSDKRCKHCKRGLKFVDVNQPIENLVLLGLFDWSE